MNPIQLLTFLKSLDSGTAIVAVLFVVLAVSQGRLTIQGIQIKKKLKNPEKPLQCLRGRAGACELVRLQMEAAEKVISKKKAEAYSQYLSIRKIKLGGKGSLAKDQDSLHYKSVIYQVADGVKDYVRYFFRENHLAEMSDAEFELHIEKRAETIITEARELLELLYYSESEPDIIELYDYNKKHLVPSLKDGVKEAFRTGRKLALKFKAGELDQHMEKVDG